MVLDTTCGSDGSGVRLLASNWVYDAIDMVGVGHLAKMARAATSLGADPQPIFLAKNSSRTSTICGDPESELARFGHNEIYALRLDTGARWGCAFFSASSPGRIRRNLVSAAQFRSAYLHSEMADHQVRAEPDDPLSERERECLFWVAEGKTTDDVALIVGVSTNTANRYIAHAIRKLSSANRARAIATAIRRGIL
jgi:DNA-binding CsgD family transcriptional regulator